MAECEHHWKIIRPESSLNSVRNPSAEESEVVGAELLANGGFEAPGGGGADIWSGWTEDVTDGVLTNEVVIVNSGNDACKITAGPLRATSVYQDLTVTPEKMYRLQFYARGNGTSAGQYRIYDLTNSVYIIDESSTGIIATAYSYCEIAFITPPACVSIRMNFYCPNVNGAVAYFDDASFKEVNVGELDLDNVLSRSTAQSKWGLYSWRLQTDANDEGAQFALDELDNADHYVTMAVRGTLPPSWSWLLGNHYRTPILLESLNEHWNLYGSPFPAAEANGSVALYIQQRGTGSGDFYIDGIQVEEKSGYNTSYVDGDQEGCAWLGTAHDSSSERSAQSRAGGKVVDLYEEYNFVVEAVTGGGAAPVRLGVAEYAILPGGELSGAKTLPRTFSMIGTIVGDSQIEIHAHQQDLIEELAADRYAEDAGGYQPVRIRYTGAKVQKEIAAHYQAGLEGQLDVHYGPYRLATATGAWEYTKRWNVAVPIRFLAPDPFWYEIGNSSDILDVHDEATTRHCAGRLRSTGQWDDLGLTANPAGNGDVNAILIASDGSVYFGGDFTNMNGIAGRDYVARYIPTTDTWETVGGASDFNGLVSSIVQGSDGTIYAGGTFTNCAGVGNADYIAQWDGSSWTAVGQPVQGASAITTVNEIAIGRDGNLYVGGNFLNWADNATADYVAKWDGAAWSGLAAGGGTGNVHGIAVDSQGDVYVGGTFINWGGIGDADHLAKWNSDTGWAAVSDQIINGGYVSGLAITNEDLLYLVGDFSITGNANANMIATWNGTKFSGLATGVGGVIYSLAIAPDGNIYVCGNFTDAGGLRTTFIARWTGGAWADIDAVLPAAVGFEYIFVLAAGNPDPVIVGNYDLWAGFTASSTTDLAGKVTLTNKGSAPRSPIIKIKRSGGAGTVTLYSIRNETTGAQLFCDYALLDDETLTIDLSGKSIVSDFSGSHMDAILPNSDFGTFELKPGDNDITCFVYEAADAASAWAEWRTRYKSYD